MGPFKSLKEVRRIVLDFMKNIHPIYRIKVTLHIHVSVHPHISLPQELMIRRELAKDPKLATESWDRFLPQFRKRHLKTSEKTAKKNDKIAQKVEARNAAGIETTAEDLVKKESTKKVYTPFPPAQLPRKVDLQLESGEYFLKQSDKEAREAQKRKQKVHTNLLLLNLQILTHTCIFSKQRLQRRSKLFEPKLLLHQRKQPSSLLRRRDGTKSAGQWK